MSELAVVMTRADGFDGQLKTGSIRPAVDANRSGPQLRKTSRS